MWNPKNLWNSVAFVKKVFDGRLPDVFWLFLIFFMQINKKADQAAQIVLSAFFCNQSNK